MLFRVQAQKDSETERDCSDSLVAACCPPEAAYLA